MFISWHVIINVTVYSQRPIVTLGANIALFYKIKDSIRELNYRGIKCEIESKMGDQKCNFALNKWVNFESSIFFTSQT